MVEYYVEHCPMPLGTAERFWSIDGNTAHENMAPSTLGSHLARDGKDVLTIIKEVFPASPFYKLLLGPGEYYPRMARPGSTHPLESPGYNFDKSATARNVRITSTGQLYALIQELQTICRVVHPVPANFQASGHEIRNLLILACTEVEAQWKGALTANGAKAKTRDDYVKLSAVMKLGEYKVSLPWFPWMDPIAPFENWVPTAKNIQQNIPWYIAYNAVKHDRENSFHEGTLKDVFHALTACFVMLCAQYGWDFARRPEQAGDSFFLLVGTPVWGPTDIYVGGGTPTARAYQF
jgi:hypothetical protein